jgi:hypothetical protein
MAAFQRAAYSKTGKTIVNVKLVDATQVNPGFAGPKPRGWVRIRTAVGTVDKVGGWANDLNESSASVSVPVVGTVWMAAVLIGGSQDSSGHARSNALCTLWGKSVSAYYKVGRIGSAKLYLPRRPHRSVISVVFFKNEFHEPIERQRHRHQRS